MIDVKRFALAAAVLCAFARPAAGADEAASIHRAVSTTAPDAQASFDRGLLMLYAFNVGQARDDFARSARIDPECAMAYWGEAVTEIIDINRTPDAAAIARAQSALARAHAAKEATPGERGLIDATAPRFAPNRTETQREDAYAAAMRAFAKANPDDADVLVLAAFSIWDLPSDVSDPRNADLGSDLDAALAIDPNHVGALHLRIHFEEALERPARALPDADRLASMTFPLGASHLDHMPGHIYDRTGDYAAMIAANERALENDRAYFAAAAAGEPDASDAGARYMRSYHEHDVAFVLYGDTTLGLDAAATDLASHESSGDAARVALRLHRWRDVLTLGTGESSIRSIAYARLGDPKRADAELGALATPLERDLTAGAEAISRGDDAAVVKAYRAAYESVAKDALGDPKDDWYAPVGEAYAAALLRSRHFASARTVFAAELERYPNDPRLLFGLERAEAGLGTQPDRVAPAASGWRGTRSLTSDDLG